ncbi:MAG: PASTA domain-containing protein, partial [candidate division Zixibacteria bacterium]|nr:PASTA domain-containing protein [candidate division Zixibacteria bacterium]
KFMASFAGFFPCEKPVIAGAVVLETPHPITYGGYTAGPAFRKIAENYSVLNPDLFTTPERMLVEKSRRLDKTVEVPDFVGRDIVQARMLAEREGVKLRGTAAEGTVVWQFPPADRILFDSDEVLVVVAIPEKKSFVMADLTGLSVRKVAAFLNFIGISYTIEGNGRVVRQSVKPGETVTTGTVCRLQCRPG